MATISAVAVDGPLWLWKEVNEGAQKWKQLGRADRWHH